MIKHSCHDSRLIVQPHVQHRRRTDLVPVFVKVEVQLLTKSQYALKRGMLLESDLYGLKGCCGDASGARKYMVIIQISLLYLHVALL